MLVAGQYSNTVIKEGGAYPVLSLFAVSPHDGLGKRSVAMTLERILPLSYISS